MGDTLAADCCTPVALDKVPYCWKVSYLPCFQRCTVAEVVCMAAEFANPSSDCPVSGLHSLTHSSCLQGAADDDHVLHSKDYQLAD